MAITKKNTLPLTHSVQSVSTNYFNFTVFLNCMCLVPHFLFPFFSAIYHLL